VIPALAAIIAFLCASASARRMWLASQATAWHPADVLAAIGKKPGREVVDRLREAAAADPPADWERSFLEALASSDERVRAALVNEQLTELDYRIQRWSRVPRVCASIATSAAFLLATLVLRKGLADTGDVSELVIQGLVGEALTTACMGLVGTAFCVAAHSHANRVARERMKGADALVETLEGALAAP
jgi:hypothetical protein